MVTYSRKVFIPLTRLCRDRCHYCTFATVPQRLPAPFLSPDEVLDIARAGAAQGCKEALFTLGDRPEDRWPQAREWLDALREEMTSAAQRQEFERAAMLRDQITELKEAAGLARLDRRTKADGRRQKK